MTPPLPPDHADRLARARLALDGLSVGDALGQTCFHPDRFAAFAEAGETAPGPWPYTDDTEMALAIYEVLKRHGRVVQADLAATFARRFRANPFRGYGPGAFKLLGHVAAGADWKAAAQVLFNGGSFGNGSAMRIAPLAGYFAGDDFATVAAQAALSAGVTHAHPEGVAGGVAAAVAGAYAWQNRATAGGEAARRGLFDAVLAHTPEGEVRRGIAHASVVEPELGIETAVNLLGNGIRVICQDTVPFCLWVAARHLGDYRAAVATTVRGRGDIDTNAAIVGGIVALAAGEASIPAEWRAEREPLQRES